MKIEIIDVFLRRNLNGSFDLELLMLISTNYEKFFVDFILSNRPVKMFFAEMTESVREEIMSWVSPNNGKLNYVHAYITKKRTSIPFTKFGIEAITDEGFITCQPFK